jgi:hypothetical protein
MPARALAPHGACRWGRRAGRFAGPLFLVMVSAALGFVVCAVLVQEVG